MVWAACLAAASAACFAAGSALQHRAAGSEPDTHGLQLMVQLAKRPSWLAGLALSGAAFLLHAAALSQGGLALVQPVIVSGIVFAVLIRSALSHRLPPTRTFLWLIATCCGLGLFLTTRPAATDHAENTTAAITVMIVGGLLTLAATVLARHQAAASRLRGVFLAVATGILYGLVAGDAKVVLAGNGPAAALTSWPLWTLLAAGLTAVVINQRAYQSTKLWVTAPIISIGEALVSILFGIVVFGEIGQSTISHLLGQGAGLGLVVVGVIKLASGEGPGAEASPPPSQPVVADNFRP